VKRHTVFVSYAHRDKRHLERLVVHLKPLEHAGLIDVWNDKRLIPGATWRHEIETAISSAKLAILLISADFLASEFITSNELPRLLRSARRGALTVLPVIVGASRFLGTSELAVFQAANDPARPLSVLPVAERERVWSRLAETVEARLAGRPLTDGWLVVNERIVMGALEKLTRWQRRNAFVIFSSGDHYVQFIKDVDRPRFNCEAVSSDFLPKRLHLSSTAVRKLRALGFVHPRGGSANFEREFRLDPKGTKLNAIASIVVRVFAQVFNSTRNANLKVSGGITS